MYIGKIIYGISYQHHDGLWEKIGVDVILNDTDNADNGRELAKEFVEDTFKKNNPSLNLRSITTIESPSIIEFDPVYEATKQQINATQFQEDAEEILIAAGFKYNLELKNIVNSKPKKQ